MKYYNVILSSILFLSFSGLFTNIELVTEYTDIDKTKPEATSSQTKADTSRTLLIEISNFSKKAVSQDPDTNFVLQPYDHELSVGRSGISLVYYDTISYFNMARYEEKVIIHKREIPIEILEVK